jgi:hypothetical protein
MLLFIYLSSLPNCSAAVYLTDVGHSHVTPPPFFKKRLKTTFCIRLAREGWTCVTDVCRFSSVLVYFGSLYRPRKNQLSVTALEDRPRTVLGILRRPHSELSTSVSKCVLFVKSVIRSTFRYGLDVEETHAVDTSFVENYKTCINSEIQLSDENEKSQVFSVKLKTAYSNGNACNL